MSIRRVLTLLCLTLAGAACGQKLPAKGCQSDAQCASDARCTSSVCTAGARPTAALAAVGTVEEFELVALDGSASSDADDDVTEHVWSIRAVEAPCAAPEVTDRSPVARIRFGCSGRYEVALSVRDELGLESEPVRAEVVVQPSQRTPVVTAGPDQALNHVCLGSPLSCRPAGDVRLTATAAPGFALRWTVVPPADRPLDGTRSVHFLPDPASAYATVELATNGTGISGDWLFRVEATDAYGVAGAAYTRVSIRNRAPVVTVALPAPFPHTFDRTRSVFTSAGSAGWSVADPDGDAVEVTGVWRHVGDGGASFDGDFDGASVTFAVEVPYAGPADALLLRGHPELLREIEVVALDANGQDGRATIPVEIGNRPPVPNGGTLDTTVPHHFDKVRRAYVATVRAGTFVDPDGDPLVDSSGGTGPCGNTRVSGNDVAVECLVPFEGAPAVDKLVGKRTFPVAARDPWDPAAVIPVQTVTILNTPPTVVAAAPVPGSMCAWVRFEGFNCPITFDFAAITFDVSATVTDPDGDPVLVSGTTGGGGTVSPAGMVLADPGTPSFHFVQPSHTIHCAAGVDAWNESFLSATDGSAVVRPSVSPTPQRC